MQVAGLHDLREPFGDLDLSAFINTASYVVFTRLVGGVSYYYAKNGMTGQVASNTDPSTLVNGLNGKIVLLPGEYLLNYEFLLDEDNIELCGLGASTIIKIKDKVETTLTVQAGIGTTTLQVVSSVGFTIGEEIIFGNMDNVSNEWEVNYITNIVGNTITTRYTLLTTYPIGTYVGAKFQAIKTDGANHISIHDLTIDGNSANNTFYPVNKPGAGTIGVPLGLRNWYFKQGNNIYVYNSNDIHIYNVNSYNASGWGGITVDNSNNCNIHDNRIIDVNTHGILVVFDSYNNLVSNNYIENIAGGGTNQLGHALFYEVINWNPVDPNIPDNTIFQSNYAVAGVNGAIKSDGFYGLYATHVQVLNNYFHNFYTGIRAYDFQALTVEGNFIIHNNTGATGYGINVGNGYNYIISSNTIINYKNSIHNNAVRSTICDNLISFSIAGEYLNRGIYFDVEGVNVAGNVINAVISGGTGIYANGANFIIDSNTVYTAQVAIRINKNTGIISNNLVTTSDYGIYFASALNNIIIEGNMMPTSPIRLFTGSTKIEIVNNYVSGITTPESNIIYHNVGYIASGEERSVSGSLTAGVANAICFAWNNPEAQDILIKKVVIEVTTGGGTVGSHLDVGIADDAAGTNRGTEFFNDLLLNNVSINDSGLAGDGGTQTKWVFCEDSAAVANDWVVGQILDANAAALVGKYYIVYAGR